MTKDELRARVVDGIIRIAEQDAFELAALIAEGAEGDALNAAKAIREYAEDRLAG